jgi:hypothetical protein
MFDNNYLNIWKYLGTAVTTSTFILNENGDYIEYQITCCKNMIIDRLFANISSVTGTPSMSLSLQGTTAGRADGVIKGSGACVATWTGAAGASWRTFDASASYNAVAGEKLSIVMQVTNAPGSTATILNRFNASPAIFQSPKYVTYDNATTTIASGASTPIYGYGNSVETFGLPISALSTTLSSTTHPGNLLYLPDYIDSATIIGIGAYSRFGSGVTGSFDLTLGSALADTNVEATYSIVSGDYIGGSNYLGHEVFFSTPITVVSGQSFRVSLDCSAGTVGLTYVDVVNSDDLKCFGIGTCFSSTRTTGNWTDITTRRYSIWPIFGDINTIAGPMVGRII